MQVLDQKHLPLAAVISVAKVGVKHDFHSPSLWENIINLISSPLHRWFEQAEELEESVNGPEHSLSPSKQSSMAFFSSN